MPGGGLHFTLIGPRGGIEGLTASELAIVTSGFFLGFRSTAPIALSLLRLVFSFGLGATFLIIALHAFHRMARRVAVPVEETEIRLNALPAVSPVAVEAAGAWAADKAGAEREAGTDHQADGRT